MANRREEERERGNSFLKVAAGLGIGYAAYKNRNQLIKGVSGVLKSGKVNLSRTANSASFRGTIGEMKSLSSAVVETYGNASPRNIARAYWHECQVHRQHAGNAPAHRQHRPQLMLGHVAASESPGHDRTPTDNHPAAQGGLSKRPELRALAKPR